MEKLLVVLGFSSADALGLALLGALTLYVLLGGADFGGGVWDLFAFGPRKQQQRELVERAIAPVWEANHVWLILVIVILFTGFPAAFSVLTTALHVPLACVLLGIVLRGSAFVFRQYGGEDAAPWGRVFAIASLLTPIFLGIVIGVVTEGTIRIEDPPLNSGASRAWTRLFPWAVGFWSLALFAFLAAVYLTTEAETPALQDDFRARAIATWALGIGLAALCLMLAPSSHLRSGLLTSPWSGPLLLLTLVATSAAGLCLVLRRFHGARTGAILQVSCVVFGWGIAQYPYLIPPDLTIDRAAAPEPTLRLLLWALIVGVVILAPSLVLLMRVFKSRRPAIPRATSIHR